MIILRFIRMRRTHLRTNYEIEQMHHTFRSVRREEQSIKRKNYGIDAVETLNKIKTEQTI